jgi:hypothetical protein
MRNITYKYNVGDTVELKPKHYHWADVMGTKVLITAAEIVERRDYNGPAYALGGCAGFYKENCFVGLASEASKNSLCGSEDSEVDTLQGPETKLNTEDSGESDDGAKYRELYLKALKKTYGKVPFETETVEVGSLLEFTEAVLEATKEV